MEEEAWGLSASLKDQRPGGELRWGRTGRVPGPRPAGEGRVDPCALRSMVSVRTWALRVSISCRAVWSFPFTTAFVGPPEPSGRPPVLGASSGIEGEVDG